MNTAILNTLKDIVSALSVGKRTLRDIAGECCFYEQQVTSDKEKELFARLATCKTRKQFVAVIDNALNAN